MSEAEFHKQELEQMIDALAHPGWKLIQKQLQDAFDEQNHLMRVASERDLYMAQGRLLTLAQLIELRDNLIGELKSLENPTTDEFSLEEDNFSEEFISRMES